MKGASQKENAKKQKPYTERNAELQPRARPNESKSAEQFPETRFVFKFVEARAQDDLHTAASNAFREAFLQALIDSIAIIETHVDKQFTERSHILALPAFGKFRPHPKSIVGS